MNINEIDKKLNGPILILGSSGQVGTALAHIIPQTSLVTLDFPEIDFSEPQKLLGIISKIGPSIIINSAAYTQVDVAETNQNLAYQINALTPAEIALWCRDNKRIFVHFSTDYVYNGSGCKAWIETDTCEPLNTYGKSKLLGDENIEKIGGRYLIFRTSWVYDADHTNFLTKMITLFSEKKELRIVDDQVGAPTFAEDLAGWTINALLRSFDKKIFPSGIYHLCNQGETSWYHFACEMLKILKTKKNYSLTIRAINPINSIEYPTPAIRPLNSRLSTEKFISMFNVTPQGWEAGLKSCMEKLPS